MSHSAIIETSPSGWLQVESVTIVGVRADITEATVLRITMKRPDTRNAFNEVMIAELTDIFNRFSQQTGLRAIILAASGPIFCAGGDLDWMKRSAEFSPTENVQDAKALAKMLQAIRDCPLPVIARVQGSAFGGGVGIVAASDIAFATEQAIFCLSEVKLGLAPAIISPYVIQKIGFSAAQRYALTAEPFSAEVAHRLGLIHEVIDNEILLDMHIEGILRHLLSNAPQAMTASKRLFQHLSRSDWAAVTEHTCDIIAERRASPEGQEGIHAFLEKRPPSWKAMEIPR
jgi:methylglutaconyl-CoA hydratase